MNDFSLIIVLIFVGFVECNDQVEPKLRIINKSDVNRPQLMSSPSGEVVYEDVSDFHSDSFEEEPIPQPIIHHIPPPPPPPPQEIHHVQYPESFGEMTKRYGQSLFGDDFALFLVLLTIAGFFGLIISMLMPFTFLLSNGGITPLNGLNGLSGINGLGLNTLGGFGGLSGLNGGIIGRKRRSGIPLKNKIADLLSLLDSAHDKYRTYKSKY